MTNRLDTEQMTAISEAARDLEDRRADLAGAVDRLTENYTAEAMGWTKPEIARHADDFGLRLSPNSASKEDMAAAYAKAVLRTTAAYAALTALQQEAGKDRIVARRINDLIDEAADAAVKLVADLQAAGGPGHVVSSLSWKTDEAMLAQQKAYYALQVVRRVDGGAELRQAVNAVARDAMTEVMGFPMHAKSNGAGGARRMEDTAKACAAADFVSRVASMVFGETVPAVWLSR
jgi:hypothetical protein